MSSVDLKEVPFNCLLLLQLKELTFKESPSVLGIFGVMVLLTVSPFLGTTVEDLGVSCSL